MGAIEVEMMTAEELERLADLVAARVLQRLAGPTVDAGLVDASEIARRFGVTRSWAYEHAHDLGAIRIGTGKRPRLRFNPDAVARYLDKATREIEAEPVRAESRRRVGSDRTCTAAGAPLLEVRP